MEGLRLKILEAQENKPAQWEPCNHCGWCCLTEVCPTGRMILKSETIPCPLLEEIGGKYYCTVATKGMADVIGIGTGCDAATQQEQLEKLNDKT